MEQASTPREDGKRWVQGVVSRVDPAEQGGGHTCDSHRACPCLAMEPDGVRAVRVAGQLCPLPWHQSEEKPVDSSTPHTPPGQSV